MNALALAVASICFARANNLLGGDSILDDDDSSHLCFPCFLAGHTPTSGSTEVGLSRVIIVTHLALGIYDELGRVLPIFGSLFYYELPIFFL